MRPPCVKKERVCDSPSVRDRSTCFESVFNFSNFLEIHMLFWRGVLTGEFLDVAYDTRIIYV